MEQVNFAERLLMLRRQKNITQEQLANFLGVTKASVSKWETRQSMPDILLLPQLAVFFNVTIDFLLGYEPQISKEQIQKIYQELALGFATEPFENIMEKSQGLVKKYYSCYPFLLQICILWLNHFMVPKDIERQQGVLQEIEKLCEHIIKNCHVVSICNDAISLKAMVKLQLGKAAEVVEVLEEITDPMGISSNNDMMLIQAYQMMGENQKARSYTQIIMYMHLMCLVGGAVQYLAIELQNLEHCQETIHRIEGLVEAYEVERLYPNGAAQFFYQSAYVYAFHGMREETFVQLDKYVKSVRHLMLKDKLKLHGDPYFDCLTEWIEQLELGAEPPRNPKMVFESLKESLEHPVFAFVQDSPEFQEIKTTLLGIRTVA